MRHFNATIIICVLLIALFSLSGCTIPSIDNPFSTEPECVISDECTGELVCIEEMCVNWPDNGTGENLPNILEIYVAEITVEIDGTDEPIFLSGAYLSNFGDSDQIANNKKFYESHGFILGYQGTATKGEPFENCWTITSKEPINGEYLVITSGSADIGKGPIKTDWSTPETYLANDLSADGSPDFTLTTNGFIHDWLDARLDAELRYQIDDFCDHDMGENYYNSPDCSFDAEYGPYTACLVNIFNTSYHDAGGAPKGIKNPDSGDGYFDDYHVSIAFMAGHFDTCQREVCNKGTKGKCSETSGTIKLNPPTSRPSITCSCMEFGNLPRTG
jgi:hypothetical protein